jgi:hypothetical protein
MLTIKAFMRQRCTVVGSDNDHKYQTKTKLCIVQKRTNLLLYRSSGKFYSRRLAWKPSDILTLVPQLPSKQKQKTKIIFPQIFFFFYRQRAQIDLHCIIGVSLDWGNASISRLSVSVFMGKLIICQ